MSYRVTGIKRKRKYGGEDYGMGRKGSQVYPGKRRRFVAGQDRVGGYYGRFSGKNAELKFHDVDLDDAVVAVTGTVTPSVNLIAQGITESTRIGRKCTLRSYHWRYQVTLPETDAAATAVDGDTVRMIVFIDKQANGATAAVTDVLESANIQSFRNLSNSGRFNILCDKLHNLNYLTLASDGAGVVSQGLIQKEFVFNKKVALPIEFSDVTGAITEIRSNNIGVLLISHRGIAGFNSGIRLRFSDQG